MGFSSDQARADASTALATAAASGARPISRSTMAPVASLAIAETFAMAAARFAAMLLFGLGQLGCELIVERLALGVGFGRDLVARGLRGRLRVGARLGERLVMLGGGGGRLVLQRGRLVDVLGDARAPRLDHAADGRQEALRQIIVHRAENQREPQQLRGKRARVERREIGVSGLVADFRLGCVSAALAIAL